jgi:hypothetical protein
MFDDGWRAGAFEDLSPANLPNLYLSGNFSLWRSDEIARKHR